MFDENECDLILVEQVYQALALTVNGHTIVLDKDKLSEEDAVALYEWLEDLHKQIEWWANG